MERYSLDQWLHVKKRSTRVSGSVYLDRPTRFWIAMGAARGLSYLHHDCLPPIIHRDVKSSNMLLDSAFNAKIADFGLARLVVKKGETSVSVVAGSFGYIAPEYAHTAKVKEKIDVYSFGVVLLELTTGKEAHLGDENTCLDEMISVFILGVKCTSKQPSDRPSMREVFQILVQYSHPHEYGH
ncbi:hypothetical protein P3X46_019476 [Hevea brasiliensis]|uniref:Protein kinase domain-containing protein n=1 Tax=Hevea brasiliensis TaxID=3981 RepID=A0ABQ9LMP3_HEVBR|nr:hypothetical protein P3X46_019476 [Hevea brasiliensis]